VKFDTKIKIVLWDGLETWQALNVNAFLMSGIAGTQNIIGKPYMDADGQEYLPMSQQPVMIHSASKEELQELLQKTIARGDIAVAIYPEELFETFDDEANRAAVARFATEDLNLVGIGLRGKKNAIDRLTKGLPLHK
jgi:hypothetical protein